MGAVSFSIDVRLIEILKQVIPFDVFVETGTFCGDTVDIIESYFKQIYSIELSKYYYEKAQERFADNSKIILINDDSATALHTIISTLQDRSIVFWLDAHWCVATATAGESSQCSLLAELNAIKKLNDNSIIIIDDARLFLSAPQKPHEISNWPTFHEIIEALLRISNKHQISVVNDCILFFPKSIQEQIKQFSHEQGIDWLDILNRCYNSEALLIKVTQENEILNQTLHNLSLRKRIRGIFGHIWRKIKRHLEAKKR